MNLQKQKNLYWNHASSVLSASLSLWTQAGLAHVPPSISSLPSTPLKDDQRGRSTITPETALTVGPSHLLPLHRRSFGPICTWSFPPSLGITFSLGFFLTNLKTIVSQVSVLVCFWALIAICGGRKRKRTQERTLGRCTRRESRRPWGPKSQIRHHSPQCPSPGDSPYCSLQGALRTINMPQTLPLLPTSSLTNLVFPCIIESAFLL